MPALEALDMPEDGSEEVSEEGLEPPTRGL